MDQADKFWEEQEQEIIEAMKRRIASKRQWTKCGTPKMIRLKNQPKEK